MKNRTLFIIGIVLMALSSCNNKCKNVPCQIIVYDEASFTKSYLINYNGKDSIETTCGALSFDIIDKLHYNQKINTEDISFREIYLRKSQKITRKQNDSLQTIICQLFIKSHNRYHPYFGKRCYISIYCIRKSTHQST